MATKAEFRALLMEADCERCEAEGFKKYNTSCINRKGIGCSRIRERAEGAFWHQGRYGQTSQSLASALAHRACCGTEHDPENGKLHGFCVVCGVPWPCETAASFLQSKSENDKG